MNATDIIGYAYDANVSCVDCTPPAIRAEDATDSEGNPVHPIFASDEDCADAVCSICGERLDGQPKRRAADMILLFDGASGQYIPQRFAQEIDRARVTGVSDEDYAILENPEHEYYWDAWDDALSTAEIRGDNGLVYTLMQDGDCWAIEKDAQLNERTGEYYVEV